MRARLIANPYIVYCWAFLVVLVLYPLHWSELYPQLSAGLIVFFVATILIALAAGLGLHRTNYLTYRDVSFSSLTLWLVSLGVFAGYLFEFAYLHVVPLIAISSGGDYDYTEFGIPTFHVVLVTFNIFWVTFVFHNLISKKDKFLVIPYILCLLPPILIFSRGIFLIMLTSSLFVMLMSTKNMRRLFFRVGILLVVLLFLFGLAGNVRISGDVTTSDTILGLGYATESFAKSGIPEQFFWAYLYITSSLANLQETINLHHTLPFNFDTLRNFLNSEFLPDFFAKRNEYFWHMRQQISQISGAFNVGTVYGRSVAYFGWWGMMAMFAYLLLFNFTFIVLLSKRSPFFVTGIAMLNALMLFNIFDNMFSFSATVGALVFPVLLSIPYKLRFLSASPQKSVVAI